MCALCVTHVKAFIVTYLTNIQPAGINPGETESKQD